MKKKTPPKMPKGTEKTTFSSAYWNTDDAGCVSREWEVPIFHHTGLILPELPILVCRFLLSHEERPGKKVSTRSTLPFLKKFSLHDHFGLRHLFGGLR